MRWPWSRRRDPEAAARLRTEAEALVGQGRIDEARARLEAAVAADPEGGRAALDLAELLLCDAGEPDAALARLRRSAAALKTLDPDDALRALWLEAEARADQGDLEAALALHERALAASPDDPWHRSGRGQRLFALARFDEARADLEAARAGLERLDPPAEDAPTHYTLACLLERDDHLREADRLFGRAAALDPETFPAPVRLPKKVFDRAVEEALRGLPDEFQRHLQNVLVETVDVPPEDMLRETGHDPLLLGLYEGVNVADTYEVDAPAVQPSRVTLYRRNIEKAAATRDEVVEQVRITLLHEVGHHLGYDDHGLDDIGLG